MKRFLKISAIVFLFIVFFFVVLLVVAPVFINIEKYRPEIEKKVSEAIGRDFSVGELRLKLFPVASIRFSKLHIGNPEGFREKEFLFIDSFDVRLKLLPLILSRDLQVKKFYAKGTRIFLIKEKNGMVNWRFEKFKKTENSGKVKKVKEEKGIPLRALKVEEFSIKDASILWIDKVSKKKTGITGINLKIKNLSFDKKIFFDLSAKIEEEPFHIFGSLGPVGIPPGKKSFPLDIKISALREVNLSLSGSVNISYPRYDLRVNLKPFSPRKLILRFKIPFRPSDPSVLKTFSLSAHVKGDSKSAFIENGIIKLDETDVRFFFNARDLKKPDVSFKIAVSRINLDRYMPEKRKKVKKKGKKERIRDKKGMEFSVLRSAKIEGLVTFSEIVAFRSYFRNIYLKISAADGILKIKPFRMNLYKGSLLANATVNLRKKIPVTSISFSMEKILIGQMLKQILGLDIITGIFDMKADFRMNGITAEKIISSLNGSGRILIKDGALIGIDLPGMIQNIKAAFGIGKAKKIERKTLFSEIRSEFTILNGTIYTKNTYLISPKLRVSTSGSASLVKETLDLRINPEYIESERSIAVPIIVSGTFRSPKFYPDLKEIIKKTVIEKKPLEEILRGIFR